MSGTLFVDYAKAQILPRFGGEDEISTHATANGAFIAYGSEHRKRVCILEKKEKQLDDDLYIERAFHPAGVVINSLERDTILNDIIKKICEWIMKVFPSSEQKQLKSELEEVREKIILEKDKIEVITKATEKFNSVREDFLNIIYRDNPLDRPSRPRVLSL